MQRGMTGRIDEPLSLDRFEACIGTDFVRGDPGRAVGGQLAHAQVSANWGDPIVMSHGGRI